MRREKIPLLPLNRLDGSVLALEDTLDVDIFYPPRDPGPHFPHACDAAHAGVPTHPPCSPVLLRAKPSKGGDAEPRSYGGLTALLAGPPAIHTLTAFFIGGGKTYEACRGDRRNPRPR